MLKFNENFVVVYGGAVYSSNHGNCLLYKNSMVIFYGNYADAFVGGLS